MWLVLSVCPKCEQTLTRSSSSRSGPQAGIREEEGKTRRTVDASCTAAGADSSVYGSITTVLFILLVFREGQLLEGEASPNVLEVRDIMVPGKPTELCYLSEQGKSRICGIARI